MMKKIFSLFLLLLTSISLCGCQNNNDDSFVNNLYIELKDTYKHINKHMIKHGTYYGEYNGAHIIKFYKCLYLETHYENICGYILEHDRDVTINVFYNDKLMDLTLACLNGLITENDLINIININQNSIIKMNSSDYNTNSIYKTLYFFPDCNVLNEYYKFYNIDLSQSLLITEIIAVQGDTIAFIIEDDTPITSYNQTIDNITYYIKSNEKIIIYNMGMFYTLDEIINNSIISDELYSSIKKLGQDLNNN